MYQDVRVIQTARIRREHRLCDTIIYYDIIIWIFEYFFFFFSQINIILFRYTPTVIFVP